MTGIDSDLDLIRDIPDHVRVEVTWIAEALASIQNGSYDYTSLELEDLALLLWFARKQGLDAAIEIQDVLRIRLGA